MTLYEKFRKLDLDFSKLGLKQGDTHSDYFCTPKEAGAIGWEGVDGIHYCFVKGFRDMVFAVNPSNLPGITSTLWLVTLRTFYVCCWPAAVRRRWSKHGCGTAGSSTHS